MDIQAWARNFTHDIRLRWEELRKRDVMFEAGFQVFYSPVKLRPELLILGFQPGGSVADFDIATCEDIPQVHQYIGGNYPLAKQVRGLFQEPHLRSTLENSIKSNMIFFRAKNVKDWNQIEPKLRKEAESYCFGKIKEMIETLQPKRVLAEGLMSYEYLKRILGLSTEDETALSKDRTLALRNKSSAVQVLGIIHPSGARINMDEWAMLCEEVKKFAA